MKSDSSGRWQFMSISARMVKRAGTRRNGATVVSHCGGSVDGGIVTGKGIFHVELEGMPGSSYWRISVIPLVLLSSLWPPAIFTENTVTAVLPVMQKPTMSNVDLRMRLWGVVLLGNILGTGIAAWAFEYMPIFNEETRDAFVKIGMDVMKNTPSEMFANAIISGWLIATMVWMFPAAGAAKDCGDYIDDLAYCLGDTTISWSVLLKSSGWRLTVRCTGAISSALRTTFGGEHLRRHLYLRVNESCTDS